MKNEKDNVKVNKKYKISKRTGIILIITIIFIVLTITIIKYVNSEKYQEKRIGKLVISWAEEYYAEKFTDIAPSYINMKAENGENITINLGTLKKFGKDTSLIKNSKYNRKCDDIDTYVVIKVAKGAKNIKKDYKVEKVVLDCFK